MTNSHTPYLEKDITTSNIYLTDIPTQKESNQKKRPLSKVNQFIIIGIVALLALTFSILLLSYVFSVTITSKLSDADDDERNILINSSIGM